MAFKISSPIYSTFIFRGQVYLTPSDGGLTKLLLEDGETPFPHIFMLLSLVGLAATVCCCCVRKCCCKKGSSKRDEASVYYHSRLRTNLPAQTPLLHLLWIALIIQ